MVKAIDVGWFVFELLDTVNLQKTFLEGCGEPHAGYCQFGWRLKRENRIQNLLTNVLLLCVNSEINKLLITY